MHSKFVNQTKEVISEVGSKVQSVLDDVSNTIDDLNGELSEYEKRRKIERVEELSLLEVELKNKVQAKIDRYNHENRTSFSSLEEIKADINRDLSEIKNR
ncbi:hypothetical protein D5018_06855 [Parashewanella curva]|uniref:Uncharacterized protein n=2 Tax=Parashewanella curva TaxID=2338552 RepID=A0A3L8PYJ8_9GAMM|nr:hypothetical protein D5018_06855 [Parashewanella curva]